MGRMQFCLLHSITNVNRLDLRIFIYLSAHKKKPNHRSGEKKNDLRGKCTAKDVKTNKLSCTLGFASAF